jgi:hypothetical protein
MPEQPIFEKAREAVEENLKAQDFINQHRVEIYARLEECDERVTKAQSEGKVNGEADIVFIAECLPMVAAILHVGSTLQNYREAIKKVSDALPDADPVAVLSALTFLYIVERGQNEAPADKTEAWKRIAKRVSRLTAGGAERQAVASSGG